MAKKELHEHIDRNHSKVYSLTKLETKILEHLTESHKLATTSKETTQQAIETLSTHCRICLASTSSTMTYLFDECSLENRHSLLEKLNYCSCLTSQAKVNDGLPQYICMSCSVLLESAYQFKVLCSKTELKLRELVTMHWENNEDCNSKPFESGEMMVDEMLNDEINVADSKHIDNTEIYHAISLEANLNVSEGDDYGDHQTVMPSVDQKYVAKTKDGEIK